MATWIIHFILLLSLLKIPLHQQNIIAQAEDAYAAREYSQAATLYEEVLADGIQNSSVFFNLGSAYYHAGQLGKALLNFHRAHQYMPRDIDIQNRISIIRGERADFQRGETGVIEEIASTSVNFISLNELAISTLLLWSIWFGMITIMWVFSRYRQRLRLVAFGCGGGLFIMLILLGSRLYVDKYRPMGVVYVPVAQVMSGPGTTYLPLYQLFDAAEIRLIEMRDGWARFVLPDGRQGWMSEDNFERV